MTAWDWIKRNAMTVIVLLALVGSAVYQSVDSTQRDTNIKQALVVVCQSTSERITLLAGAQRTLSKTVSKGSDIDQFVADGLTELIPVAPPTQKGDPRLIESKLIHPPGRTPRFVLTDSARKLQTAGCEHLYDQD